MLKNPQFIKGSQHSLEDSNGQENIYRNFLEDDSIDNTEGRPSNAIDQPQTGSAESLLAKHQRNLRINTMLDDVHHNSVDKIDMEFIKDDDFFEKIDKLKRNPGTGSLHQSSTDSVSSKPQ